MNSLPSLLKHSLKWGCSSALIAAMLGNSALASETPKEIWHDAIASGYASLADQAQVLHNASAAYCNKPSSDARTAITAAWGEAFDDWQAVRFVDFGPIERNNMAWQFQFWPDPKNTIARKADFWLNGEQPITQEQLEGDSIAVKGFPALEYLLFDPAAAKSHPLPDERSCDLLTGISSLIQRNSKELREQWQAFRPHYLANDQFQRTTILAAMHSLELIRNKRLGAPMGLQGKPRRNAYLADAWRSEHSLPAIRATLNGLQDYFLPGLRAVLTTPAGEELANRFDRQLSAAITRLDKQPASMRQLLADDDGYRSLQLVFIEIDKLNQLLGGEIASELGIVRGFNSTDGD